MNIVLYIFIFLSVLLMLSILTKNKGTARVIIINSVSNFLLMYIVGLSYLKDEEYLIDLAILYAALNAMGGISFLIYSKFKENKENY